ncbi:Zn(2)-C6 fungal-type DNA-binding domain superfamily [Fusarium oxysporum f. sp. vasinfectum]|nr:Zn(2)-C6 fungal-type DNA-binding domain superfamily [Fusarium oxysporum f. sp. vasinfectum]
MSIQIPRRQKRSCLQCQKAKRACDGYALNRDPDPSSSLASSPTSSSSSDQDHISSIRPCSYCQKTSKACSLNSIWGLTRIRVNQGLYNPNVPRPLKNRVSDRTLSEGSASPIKTKAATSSYEYTSSSVKSTLQSDAEPSQYRQKRIYGEQNLSTVLSLSTANVSMAAIHNNQLITRNLFCIYHDVLENNLSCWISEVTCPYSMSYSSQESIAPALTNDDAAYSSCTFGPINPFYQHIFQLDRATQRLWKPLSHKEDIAVSRTLHLCILAFAAQWTQKQARKRTVSSETVGHLQHSDTPATMPMDYSLQLLLWEQARTALQQNMEIECFRIVYAEFIFGITERPEPKYNQDYNSHRNDIGLSKDQHSAIHFIGRVMSNERPSLHLEQATRKMFVLKDRFEMEELKSKRGPRDIYALQQRRTVAFIYWLLVMFDTVVSPLNKRPVVIADEHCMTGSILNTEDESCQWRLDMFLKDDSKMPQSFRWPCSEEVASRAMIKAAPIKVLLYRQLSYIQNALREKSSIQNIINATKGAITVCRYWDMTYASLFQGMLRGYDRVSSKLRSWVVCIFTAWNLGTLVLADLLELVHEKATTGDKISHAPDSYMDIRQSSAINLAELAGAVVPHKTSHVEQLPKCHATVQESPLLTDPCTSILVEAFTRSSLYHLSTICELKKHERFDVEMEGFRQSLQWFENCVRALTCVSKRSKLAESIAESLLPPLRELQGT